MRHGPSHASALNLTARPLRFELESLTLLQFPAIVHWDMTHFVVLKSASAKAIVVPDPAQGERRLSLAEASHHLTGVALELSPAEAFVRKDERSRQPFAAFLGHSMGMGHLLAQVLAMSVVLEILVVLGPLYMQLAVDQVIAMGDVDLLVVLAFGFGLLAAIRVAVTALRSLVILVIQNALHYQIGGRLFHDLLRLPLSFFEKRHVGDVLPRFTSIEPI